MTQESAMSSDGVRRSLQRDFDASLKPREATIRRLLDTPGGLEPRMISELKTVIYANGVSARGFVEYDDRRGYGSSMSVGAWLALPIEDESTPSTNNHSSSAVRIDGPGTLSASFDMMTFGVGLSFAKDDVKMPYDGDGPLADSTTAQVPSATIAERVMKSLKDAPLVTATLPLNLVESAPTTDLDFVCAMFDRANIDYTRRNFEYSEDVVISVGVQAVESAYFSLRFPDGGRFEMLGYRGVPLNGVAHAALRT